MSSEHIVCVGVRLAYPCGSVYTHGNGNAAPNTARKLIYCIFWMGNSMRRKECRHEYPTGCGCNDSSLDCEMKEKSWKHFWLLCFSVEFPRECYQRQTAAMDQRKPINVIRSQLIELQQFNSFADVCGMQNTFWWHVYCVRKRVNEVRKYWTVIENFHICQFHGGNF